MKQDNANGHRTKKNPESRTRSAEMANVGVSCASWLALARSRSIQIHTEQAAEQGPVAEVGLDGLVDVDAKVTSMKTDVSTWQFEGEQPVALGDELAR